MKIIPLTNNEFTIVDDENFDRFSKYKWHLDKRGRRLYAKRDIVIEEKRTTIYMHQEIIIVPNGLEIDHKNSNGLDNRKENLRICNRTQNNGNRRKRLNCSSKYKGVSWNNGKKKWQSAITVYGKTMYLGRFNDEIKAAEVYDDKAIEIFGEFSRLNFPERKK
jgi:hypothetical protein